MLHTAKLGDLCHPGNDEVEKIYATLYTQALEMLGKETGPEDFYICPFCGYTHEGKFEGKCPVCGAPFEKFACIG
ncbi:MAG: rubredoxin-like domain-containing protein [Chloroflexota bacterium]